MRGSLGVRISDGRTDRIVTKAVSGLRYTKTAPGGFHSASMTLRLPVDTFDDLGPADRIWVYDTRTGKTMWEGFAENPGAATGPGGQEFELSALGSTTLAGDESRALIYFDRDLERWDEFKSSFSAPSASAQTSEDPTDTTGVSPTRGLLCQMNPGQPIGSNKVAASRYLAIEEAGMTIGYISATVSAGKNDAGYVPDLTVRTAGGSANTLNILPSIQVAPFEFSYVAGASSPLPLGRTRAELRLKRTGAATNVADDNTWTFFYEILILPQYLDRFGAIRPMFDVTGYETAVETSSVVEDLVGRMMGYVDTAAAVIQTGGALIDQLAYPDGITVQQFLDDLTLWEPDYLWELLENTGRGYRFRYRAWPTEHRYEVSERDGAEIGSSDIDLCNRVAVYWTDERGQRRTTVVTSTVPALDVAGRTRDAEPIDLPEGLGSEANAQRIGSQLLASKATPPRAGSATVNQPIYDRLRGAYVMPWEIEPGYLARIRETGEDLRLTEVEYNDEDCAATLTLGTPVLTEEQRIAKLSQRRR